jgi:hypothetical protein
MLNLFGMLATYSLFEKFEKKDSSRNDTMIITI